jgi:chromosome segregation ATPase
MSIEKAKGKLEQIEVELEQVRREIKQALDEVRGYQSRKRDFEAMLSQKEATIPELEKEFDRVAKDVAQSDLSFNDAAGQAMAIAENRRQAEVEIDLLQRTINHLAVIIAQKTEKDPLSGQYPTSLLQDRESLLGRRLRFWEKMISPARDAENLQADVIHEAGFCSFSTDENKEADQILRGICKERGWNHGWSYQLIG